MSPPGTGDPLLGGFPQDSPDSTPELSRDGFTPREGKGYEEFRRGVLKKNRSNGGSLGSEDDYEQYMHKSDTERLRKGTPSIRSAYESKLLHSLILIY